MKAEEAAARAAGPTQQEEPPGRDPFEEYDDDASGRPTTLGEEDLDEDDIGEEDWQDQMHPLSA